MNAMVLAAGLGLRLRPITNTIPKPLVAVGGRTMLDRALDHLEAAGVADAVVNTHYLAEKIESHLAARASPRIHLSHEPELLETGGGITKALPHLGNDAFHAVNADIIWEDGASPALRNLAAAWDDSAMDALLLLQPVETAVGYDGAGDFYRNDDGSLRRRGSDASAPYVFTGVQMLHPRLFDGVAVEPFSMNILYNRALAAGRLRGLAHDGAWYHVGTPEALDEAEKLLSARDAGRAKGETPGR